MPPKGKTRHGYCRKGRHGPRTLYRVQAEGITIGWWCQSCIKSLKGDAEQWKTESRDRPRYPT